MHRADGCEVELIYYIYTYLNLYIYTSVNPGSSSGEPKGFLRLEYSRFTDKAHRKDWREGGPSEGAHGHHQLVFAPEQISGGGVTLNHQLIFFPEQIWARGGGGNVTSYRRGDALGLISTVYRLVERYFEPEGAHGHHQLVSAPE